MDRPTQILRLRETRQEIAAGEALVARLRREIRDGRQRGYDVSAASGELAVALAMLGILREQRARIEARMAAGVADADALSPAPAVAVAADDNAAATLAASQPAAAGSSADPAGGPVRRRPRLLRRGAGHAGILPSQRGAH